MGPGSIDLTIKWQYEISQVNSIEPKGVRGELKTQF